MSTLVTQPPRGPSRAETRRRFPKGKVLTYLALIALSVIYLYPFLWSISTSLKPLGAVYEVPPRLLVEDPQWENYETALTKLPFHKFFFNSLILTSASVVGTLVSSAVVGYAFGRLEWRGRDVCFVLMLATMMLPSQILMIPRYLIFQSLGWVGTYKPLIVPAWLGANAFGIFLFRQFFKSQPKELGEAASIDGASAWQTFLLIYLPLTKPVMATLFVLTLVSTWQDFLGPLVYLFDYEKFPLGLGLYMYKSIEGSWINLIAAASLVTLLPLLVIFFVFQKYLIHGMTLTAGKE